MSKTRKTKHYTDELFDKAIKEGDLDSGIFVDEKGYWVEVWTHDAFWKKIDLKFGGPYKTEQAAKFAERKMCYI